MACPSTVNADTLPDSRRAFLIKAASYASLSVALSLVAIKLWAWLTTGSVSLLGSLADSLLDVVASGLTFVAVRVSLEPADAEHRFGHGKSEGLAALAQALIIAGSAVYVALEAVTRLIVPQPIEKPMTGIAVMLGATAATALLVGFQRYVARSTDSMAIRADAGHYQADIAVNLGVAAAIVLTSVTGWVQVDPIVGLMVAVWILISAWGIATDALDVLLDKEISAADRQLITDLAMDHPDVLGLHDLRTRSGGSKYFIQFHLEMDPEMALSRVHVVMDEVEARIQRRWPGCEIIVHADPLGVDETRDSFD